MTVRERRKRSPVRVAVALAALVQEVEGLRSDLDERLERVGADLAELRELVIANGQARPEEP